MNDEAKQAISLSDLYAQGSTLETCMMFYCERQIFLIKHKKVNAKSNWRHSSHQHKLYQRLNTRSLWLVVLENFGEYDGQGLAPKAQLYGSNFSV